MDALSRYVGWSAIVSAIATVLGLATLIMFFTLGQPWGAINDITSVVLALSSLPVLLALYRLHRRSAPAISLVAVVIGVIAMLVAVAFQTLLVLGVIAFAQTAVIVPAAFGLFGVSLILFGYCASANGTLPRRLVLLGIFAGSGYIATIAGFLMGGEQHPLTALGGLLAVFCYPLWAVSFGRLLLSGRLTLAERNEV